MQYRDYLKYGLIAGTLLIIVKYILLVSIESVNSQALLLDYAGLLGLAGVSYWAVATARASNGGAIPFKEAMLVSLFVSFVAAIMVGFFMMIYVKYIDPAYVEKIIEKSAAVLQRTKVPEEAISDHIQKTRAAYSPMSQFLSGSIVIVYGLFISLIIAAITSSKKTQHA